MAKSTPKKSTSTGKSRSATSETGTRVVKYSPAKTQLSKKAIRNAVLSARDSSSSK